MATLTFFSAFNSPLRLRVSLVFCVGLPLDIELLHTIRLLIFHCSFPSRHFFFRCQFLYLPFILWLFDFKASVCMVLRNRLINVFHCRLWLMWVSEPEISRNPLRGDLSECRVYWKPVWYMSFSYQIKSRIPDTIDNFRESSSQTRLVFRLRRLLCSNWFWSPYFES